MDLSEMLALLPDNSTGEISAGDLRAIVTALYDRGQIGQSFSYLWTTTPGPGAGKVTMTAWTTAATVVQISETTDDGQNLTFAALDSATNPRLVLMTADGSTLHAAVTGASVDNGGWRAVPVAVQSVTGPAPSLNERVSVIAAVVLP